VIFTKVLLPNGKQQSFPIFIPASVFHALSPFEKTNAASYLQLTVPAISSSSAGVNPLRFIF